MDTLQQKVVAAAGNDAAAEETATWCAKRLPAPLVVVLNRCSQESIMPPLKLQTFCQVWSAARRRVNCFCLCNEVWRATSLIFPVIIMCALRMRQVRHGPHRRRYLQPDHFGEREWGAKRGSAAKKGSEEIEGSQEQTYLQTWPATESPRWETFTIGEREIAQEDSSSAT